MIDNICAERYVEKSKYRVNGKVLTGGLFCAGSAVADAVLNI